MFHSWRDREGARRLRHGVAFLQGMRPGAKRLKASNAVFLFQHRSGYSLAGLLDRLKVFRREKCSPPEEGPRVTRRAPPPHREPHRRAPAREYAQQVANTRTPVIRFWSLRTAGGEPDLLHDRGGVGHACRLGGVVGARVITSRAVARVKIKACDSRRTTTSRSVTMPTRRSFSPIGIALTSRLCMIRAISVRRYSAPPSGRLDGIHVSYLHGGTPSQRPRPHRAGGFGAPSSRSIGVPLIKTQYPIYLTLILSGGANAQSHLTWGSAWSLRPSRARSMVR